MKACKICRGAHAVMVRVLNRKKDEYEKRRESEIIELKKNRRTQGLASCFQCPKIEFSKMNGRVGVYHRVSKKDFMQYMSTASCNEKEEEEEKINAELKRCRNEVKKKLSGILNCKIDTAYKLCEKMCVEALEEERLKLLANEAWLGVDFTASFMECAGNRMEIEMNEIKALELEKKKENE